MSLSTHTDEAVSGPRVVSESPAAVQQESRIRAALGLAGGPLPGVDARTLRKYYVHLASNLWFPFEARYHEQVGWLTEQTHTVAVLDVLDPFGNVRDEFGGIRCKVRMGRRILEVPLAELEVPDGDPHHQLLEDYWYWFWNWRQAPGALPKPIASVIGS